MNRDLTFDATVSGTAATECSTVLAADRSEQRQDVQATRVLYWGTYDLGKPRTRILRDGLRGIGADVIEIHADIWPRHDDKSQMRPSEMALSLLRAVMHYPLLLFRYLRAPDHNVVFVPYLGALDVLVLWPFARLRRRTIVWDMFLSLYDTVVNDRRMVPERSPKARALRAVEWLACRAADRVLLDTGAHARYVSRLFSLPDGKVGAVPVGAEPGRFPRLPARAAHAGPVRILFYGQLIPLHGLQTILDAALSERGRAFEWRIIGTGQERNMLEAALARAEAGHVTWQDWVPYNELIGAIAQADICLGIFGASEKAASVVPNKVYQCLMAGRSVITRQSPAMSETFPSTHPGLRLVPESDPGALLNAIGDLQADGYPVMPLDDLKLAEPEEIARTFCREILFFPPADRTNP